MAGGSRSGGIGWAPQGKPQRLFVTCPHLEAVYGGARGGGKTDASLGDFSLHAFRYRQDAKGLFVRRNGASLLPTIERARQIYTPMGAAWQEAKHRFVFPGGGTLIFRHLENLADADLYQGHDYSRVYVEELTQFPTSAPVDKLKATLRSAAGVPCGFRATCNPGGPGHNWVKARYIDNGPYRVVVDEFVNPFTGQKEETTRVFIPARLTDNPRLLGADPGYVGRLMLAGSKELVKAWLEGDWNIIEGAFFDGWATARNVIEPFTIPPLWTRMRSFDWGYAKPFSVGWWAVVSDDYQAGRVRLPRGALVRYREWYGCTGNPDEGLRLDAEAVARGIVERDAGEKISLAVADPAIFAENGGPSIGERMRRAGVWFRPADNTRVGKAGAMSGWDQVRARIRGDLEMDEAGKVTLDEGPMLAVFKTCRDFIRTVPTLQHDGKRPEDLDTSAEDHIADETRYACLARPLIAKAKVPSTNPNDGYRRRHVEENDWRTR